MRHECVCVIDDDPTYIYGMKLLIRRVEFSSECLTFANGKEALDYFVEAFEARAQVPEIIFLDLNMPVLDGWQFLDRIIPLLPKHNPPLIYLVSSSIDPRDAQRARAYDVVSEFIVKPVSAATLEALM